MQPFATICPPAGVASAPIATDDQPSNRWGFLELFILAQVVLPSLLFLPGTQSLRVPIRIAPFAIGAGGLLALLWHRRKVPPHPATGLLLLVIIYLSAMIASPQTNTPLAGVAQVLLYFSAIAPVFWAARLVESKRQVQRIMTILLICNGANAVVGVLQVKFPETFMPRELSSVYEMVGTNYGQYTGPNGQTIIRPPGLSDNPGAVCGPASVAALLGMVMAIRPIGFWRRSISATIAFAGVAAIFLSHVRSSLLVMCGMCAVYFLLLVIQGQSRRAFAFAGLTVALVVAGLAIASVLGGEAVRDRFASLFDDDPATVYERSRGFMLIDTQRYLAENPMGAGLGRWGMMRLYFGNEDNANSPPLWAEIQFPAWALDGGIVVLVLYLAALALDVVNEWRGCLSLHKTAVASDMAVILASNAGVLALMFSFTPFTTQMGVQYWFLAGVLHGVANLPREELA